ncbi:prolipoprotein diacylglyceryl transferase [Flammeovirgaceae bacterium SG7u.111]|nr:prolipoprotein diacylglyceryl transferase [Flammeovirgaceae bacterium SG7u.132]WPO34806.1 prolipoprotein diacylglyceryl transferase [Flammeovirgaceae bacterium SG7u.111]
MHPVFFEFETPDFLKGIFPDTVTIYSYGFLIALGATFAFLYAGTKLKKEYGHPFHKSADMALILLLASFVGGRFFFYLEDPGYYFSEPSRMLENLGQGFVFYGSLLFCIPSLLVYLKLNKLPVWGVLDVMAITACIVHMFGRMGCFMAGCCYGLPWEGGVCAVQFNDAASMAKPLHTDLHPTQLYSVTLIGSILLLLLWLKPRKKFDGQLFLLYAVLYAIGRSIIEMFRGDVHRGFVIGDWLSHSQLIALVMLSVVAWFYRKKMMESRG